MRFLLGPAGSGKTFLCLDEIRRALLEQPSDPALLLLAPKQATFQLERQLLAEPALQGYMRLHILSFERLADFVLTQLRQPVPPLLSENGRIMVLRALLARRRDDLQIFRASAGLAGFATQLSHQLRELQRRRLAPESVRALAGQPGASPSLRRKLLDLALLLADYQNWLSQHNFADADSLPDLAAAAPALPAARTFFISALWLDGFAEITPQELNLLAALAPHCPKMTLAFCLESESPHLKSSWLSIWNSIGKTFDQCRARFSTMPDASVTVEVLRRQGTVGRFNENPVLRHLEEHWTHPVPFPNCPGGSNILCVWRSVPTPPPKRFRRPGKSCALSGQAGAGAKPLSLSAAWKVITTTSGASFRAIKSRSSSTAQRTGRPASAGGIDAQRAARRRFRLAP